MIPADPAKAASIRATERAERPAAVEAAVAALHRDAFPLGTIVEVIEPTSRYRGYVGTVVRVAPETGTYVVHLWSTNAEAAFGRDELR